jgi:hypothetical protein
MAMGNKWVEWHEVTVWCVWQLDSYLLTQSMECYGWHEVTVWCVWQLDSYLHLYLHNQWNVRGGMRPQCPRVSLAIGFTYYYTIINKI